MENSSNRNMKGVFEQLTAIKSTEPDEGLYVKTLKRLQRKNTIAFYWVGYATCGLIILVAIESYVASNTINKSNQGISPLIYKTNNTLYYE